MSVPLAPCHLFGGFSPATPFPYSPCYPATFFKGRKAAAGKMSNPVFFDLMPLWSKKDSTTEKRDMPVYHPDRPLYLLGDQGQDWFTIRDACQGIQVLGGTGSGKTSGTGFAFARAYLKAQFGGLVLCAKPEERILWEKLAHQTGRTDDLIIVRPDAPWKFNFLDYEATRSGKGARLTVNIVHLLTEIVKSIDREERGEGEKPFWRNALRQLVTAAVDLALSARLPLRFDLLGDIVRSGPKSLKDVDDQAWQQRSVCYQCIHEADNIARDEDEEADFQQCRAYWLSDFATLASETRSSIVLSFTMLTHLFTTRPLRRLLSTETTITPEATFDQKIIIIDMPLQDYFQAGRIAQFVWKYMWQKAALRRHATDETVPIFLWIDESQNFISDFDPEFQAVARSAKACTVYLTQNISLYKKVLGTGSDDAVEAFLGNLQCKVFHQNSSSETNTWAADLFAKDLLPKETTGATAGDSVSGSRSVTHEEQYQLRPIEFTRLLTGGRVNKGMVQAFMYKGGTRFQSNQGRNWIQLVFFQEGFEPPVR